MFDSCCEKLAAVMEMILSIKGEWKLWSLLLVLTKLLLVTK